MNEEHYIAKYRSRVSNRVRTSMEIQSLKLNEINKYISPPDIPEEIMFKRSYQTHESLDHKSKQILDFIFNHSK